MRPPASSGLGYTRARSALLTGVLAAGGRERADPRLVPCTNAAY